MTTVFFATLKLMLTQVYCSLFCDFIMHYGISNNDSLFRKRSEHYMSIFSAFFYVPESKIIDCYSIYS